MVGLDLLSGCSGSPKRDRRNSTKNPFRSNPNLAITKAGGTLPIPMMYRVIRRAQKGSPDLCSSASPTALSAKKKPPQPSSQQDCKERAGLIKSSLHPETQLLLKPLSWSPTPPNPDAPWLGTLGSHCLLSQCPIIPVDQAGPESLPLVPHRLRPRQVMPATSWYLLQMAAATPDV